MDNNSEDLLKENEILSKENAALQQQLHQAKESQELNEGGITDFLAVINSEDKICRILIEKIHDGAITLDGDGAIKYCNSSFAKMMNIAADEAVGTKFRNYIADSSKEYFDSLFRQGHDNYIKEEVHINMDNGKVFPALMLLNTLWLDNHFVLSIIVTELTFWNKNQADVMMLAALVESSDDSIIIKTLDGTIKRWSKGSEKMFGYTSKEALGKPITLIIPPEFINAEEEATKRIRNNEIVQYNTVRNKKNGEKFDISITVSPLKDMAGNIIGSSNIARDIMPQKKLEQELISTNNELIAQNKEKEEMATTLNIVDNELKVSEDRFFKIFDYNPISMVMTNLETGKAQNVNKSFLSFFGYKSEEVIGKTAMDLNIYDLETRNKYVEMLRTNGKLEDLESLVRKKNGGKFLTLATAQIITINGVKLILTSFQDITDRKKAEDELKNKTIQLEQKNVELERTNKELAIQIEQKEKGVSALNVSANNVKELEELVSHKESILAVLSHDLRSPLTGIIGLADYLKTEFEDMDRSEAQHVINLLDESAKKELTMLDNLVEWARIKYASEIFVPANIKLQQYVQQAIDALHETAALKEISLYNEIEEYTTVFADENMLLSILQNIVSNAVKYSTSGGTITIRSKIKDDKIIVEVEDHGAGMSKKVIDEIFNPQMKNLSEARRENKGAGIGLLLAKEFLAKNNGEIWVESVEGEGSSFFFTLPINNS